MGQATRSYRVILFLDDSPERAAKVFEHMTAEEQGKTIWCKTSEEAIITFRDYCDRIDFAFLDHDLGIPDQNFHSIDSGMEVVRYLEKNPFIVKELKNNQCKFIIHSHNPPASRIMVERLQDLGFEARHQPFGS